MTKKDIETKVDAVLKDAFTQYETEDCKTNNKTAKHHQNANNKNAKQKII